MQQLNFHHFPAHSVAFQFLLYAISSPTSKFLGNRHCKPVTMACMNARISIDSLSCNKMNSFCHMSTVVSIQLRLQVSNHSSFAPWHCLLPVCMFLDPIYVHGSWDTCRVRVSSNQRCTPDDRYVCKIRKWVHPLCLWYNTIGKVYEQWRMTQLIEIGRSTLRKELLLPTDSRQIEHIG